MPNKRPRHLRQEAATVGDRGSVPPVVSEAPPTMRAKRPRKPQGLGDQHIGARGIVPQARACEDCGARYVAERPWARYCSPLCRDRAWRSRRVLVPSTELRRLRAAAKRAEKST